MRGGIRECSMVMMGLSLLWHSLHRTKGEASPTGRTSQMYGVRQMIKQHAPDGRQARVQRRSLASFFPLGGVQAQMLQEQKGDQRQQRMPMQTAPGAALEVIKPEFLFQLLMRLLADPPRLD